MAPADRAPNDVGNALQPMGGVSTTVCFLWSWRWRRHGLPQRRSVGRTGPVVKAKLVVAERVVLAIVVRCFERARNNSQDLTRLHVCSRVATSSDLVDAVACCGIVKPFAVDPMGAFAAQERHGEKTVVECCSR